MNSDVSKVASLNRDRCIRWVGAIFLESQQTSANGILIPDFIQEWQNYLPESWRRYAGLEALKASF